jgi:NAD(P)-dependent dehydrogenase (short-subunit alcohol dehydrogenase family)
MADEPKIMLLTGASRGIGHATVKLFQERGWKILTVSRQPFSEECRWPAARWSHVQADLADLDSIEALAETVRSRLPDGKLHALVNNAGISPKGEEGARLGVLGTDAATWMQVLNVNFISTALLVRALVNELEAGKASIVNVASIAGSRVHPFAGVAYAASKAALATLTRARRRRRDARASSRMNWGRAASAPTPSRRARSTPPSCRRAPRNWSTGWCRWDGSASRSRLRKPFTSCAREGRPISTGRRSISTAASTSEGRSRRAPALYIDPRESARGGPPLEGNGGPRAPGALDQSRVRRTINLHRRAASGQDARPSQRCAPQSGGQSFSALSTAWLKPLSE